MSRRNSSTSAARPQSLNPPPRHQDVDQEGFGAYSMAKVKFGPAYVGGFVRLFLRRRRNRRRPRTRPVPSPDLNIGLILGRDELLTWTKTATALAGGLGANGNGQTPVDVTSAKSQHADRPAFSAVSTRRRRLNVEAFLIVGAKVDEEADVNDRQEPGYRNST